jgi:hypothetical protein
MFLHLEISLKKALAFIIFEYNFIYFIFQFVSERLRTPTSPCKSKIIFHRRSIISSLPYTNMWLSAMSFFSFIVKKRSRKKDSYIESLECGSVVNLDLTIIIVRPWRMWLFGAGWEQILSIRFIVCWNEFNHLFRNYPDCEKFNFVCVKGFIRIFFFQQFKKNEATFSNCVFHFLVF